MQHKQAPADAQYFKAVLDNVYDKLEESQKPPAASLSSAFQFTHLRGRLTKSIAYNYIDNSGYQVTNWYSYDNDGNLWLSIQDIPGDGLRVSAYSYDNLGRKTSERFYENADQNRDRAARNRRGKCGAGGFCDTEEGSFSMAKLTILGG